jgi:high-affinity iron transporter
MAASFLLALREGIEAALIIGIVLGALSKVGRQALKPAVWWGVLAAVGASTVAALILSLVGMELEGRAEQVFEGVAMLLAAGVLTWMIFWMRRQAGQQKGELEAKTGRAIAGQGRSALFTLAFLAVFREGIELALFLVATQASSSPLQTLAGALLGLAGAAALGWLLFTGTRRLSLRLFFRVTNILLVIFAAGLVGLAAHELIEAGWLPAIIEHVWDINPLLSDTSELGRILRALVGYVGSPSLMEVIAYLAYLGGVTLGLARKPVR